MTKAEYIIITESEKKGNYSALCLYRPVTEVRVLLVIVVTDNAALTPKTANLRESTQIAALFTRAWLRLSRSAGGLLENE